MKRIKPTTYLVEAFSAQRTLVVLLIGVRLQMTRESRVIHKAFITHRTLQRFQIFVTVTQHMLRQPLLRRKRLPTFRALMRLIGIKRAEAVCAPLLGLSVFAHMEDQGPLVLKLFVAYGTAERAILGHEGVDGMPVLGVGTTCNIVRSIWVV